MDQVGAIVNRVCNDTPSDYVCKFCGRTVKPVKLHAVGKTIFIAGTCKCEDERRHQREKRLQDEDRIYRTRLIMQRSDMGERLRTASFQNFERRPGTEKAYQAANEWAKNYSLCRRGGEWLFIHGPCGNGKSHLLAAIVNGMLRRNIPSVFQNVPALFERLASMYGKRREREEFVQTLVDVEVLALDDIGAQAETEAKQESIFYLIDTRYKNNKATILSANSLPEVEMKCGKRVSDRLLEMCLIVENAGTSYREQIAEKRLEGKR